MCARNGIPPNSRIDVDEKTAESALFLSSLDIDINRRYDDRKEQALSVASTISSLDRTYLAAKGIVSPPEFCVLNTVFTTFAPIRMINMIVE